MIKIVNSINLDDYVQVFDGLIGDCDYIHRERDGKYGVVETYDNSVKDRKISGVSDGYLFYKKKNKKKVIKII
jgi:hypothetical protein